MGAARHFGRMLGSPPGAPGGGITGVLPISGARLCISLSTLGGGQRTPSDLASLSPNAPDLAADPSRGETVPWSGRGSVGVQFWLAAEEDAPGFGLSCAVLTPARTNVMKPAIMHR